MTDAAKWNLDVLDVRQAGRDFIWMHLAVPADWRSTPGQFVNVLCEPPADGDSPRVIEYTDDGPRPRLEGREVSRVAPLVRRPVSISDFLPRDGGRELVLLVRIVGPGSRLLGEKRPGDRLDLIGPIGNGFDLGTEGDRAVLVGGGCGVAPLVGLARQLAERGKDVTVFYGCGDTGAMPLTVPETAGPTGKAAEPVEGVAEFPSARVVFATEDGSLGTHGLVTDAMADWGRRNGWDGVSIFACGPDVMMAATSALAHANAVRRCQVSLENYMGCAVGLCLSCAAKIRADNDQGWTHKLVCQDGPVFEAADVIFESKWEGCTP